MATPLAVFDELWSAFSHHCAFLHLRTSTREWHRPEFRDRYRSRVAALPQTEEAATGPELTAVLGDVVRLFSEDSTGVRPDIHCFLVDAERKEIARNDPPAFTAFDEAAREPWMCAPCPPTLPGRPLPSPVAPQPP